MTTTQDWTANSTNQRVFKVRVVLNQPVWAHRHDGGARIHLFNASAVAWEEAPLTFTGEPRCGWNQTMRFSEVCGELGDSEHPLRLVCRHCYRIARDEELLT